MHKRRFITYNETETGIKFMEYKIKRPKEKDYKAIFNLLYALAVHHDMQDKLDITAAQLLKDKDLFGCFIAVNKGKLLGLATYYFTYHTWSGRGVHLDDLYIIEKYRGKGIGQALLQRVVEVADRIGAPRVEWTVAPWNDRAINFYKRWGADLYMEEQTVRLYKENYHILLNRH